jgi:hypothetical protein
MKQKTGSFIFEKINDTDKLLANLTKIGREGEKTQTNKIRNKKRVNHNKHQGNPGNHQELL